MDIPLLVVHVDAEQVEELKKRGIPGLFGDAANSEVLKHAGLKSARALVVAGPDETASELVVAAARDLAPELPIIARAATREGVKRLAELGAQVVVHAELEAGLEVLRHTLLQLGFPMQEITRYTDAVRRDRYDLQVNTEEEHRLLQELIDAIQGIEVTWLRLEAGSSLVGQTLAQGDLRRRTGASVVAILRGKQLNANPKSMTTFEAGDRIALIGDPEQIEQAQRLVEG
jgi:CPA2 family monovalent cation:H+ antiporter-2